MQHTMFTAHRHYESVRRNTRRIHVLGLTLLFAACNDDDSNNDNDASTTQIASTSTNSSEGSSGTSQTDGTTSSDGTSGSSSDGEASGTTAAACVPLQTECSDQPWCFGDLMYPTDCGPLNCDEPIGPCTQTCDPSSFCGDVQTCIDGMLYPTSCGPDNCDMPIGPC